MVELLFRSNFYFLFEKDDGKNTLRKWDAASLDGFNITFGRF